MNVIQNDKLIKRNRIIGQVATVVALLVLGAGIYISFTDKESKYIAYTFAALIFGFLLSQIGMFYSNKWGRSPRPDELITQALKGLGGKYELRHFTSSVPHLLIGDHLAWILIPYHQTGTITYDEQKKIWKQKGGNWYLKIFGQEKLGRPDLDVKSQVAELEKELSKDNSGADFEIRPVLIFLNPKTIIDTKNAPVPTLPLSKLKEHIRQYSRKKDHVTKSRQLVDQS